MATNATFGVFRGASTLSTQHKHKQQTQIINLIKMMSNPEYVQWFDANEDSAAMTEEIEADNMLNAIVMELLSLLEEEEEEEEDEDENKWGGSRKGRSPNKERDFAEAYARLVKDYFNGSASVYNEIDFERRFCMPRAIFKQIQDAVMGTDPLFRRQTYVAKLAFICWSSWLPASISLPAETRWIERMRTFELPRVLWLQL